MSVIAKIDLYEFVSSRLYDLSIGIHVWVLGQTEVSWTDKPGGRKVHFDYEIYMKDCITLCGRGKFYIFIFV